jgi:hypothetical protein
MDKDQIKDITIDTGIDTGLYLGTKYLLHIMLDFKDTKNVNFGDAAIFIISDLAYQFSYHYLYVTKKFAQPLIIKNPIYNCDLSKYGGLILGVTILNFFTDRSGRMVDNIISIGTSGAVSGIVDALRGESRCVK